jgi:cytochrome bd-type quinol oxidase subunit 2
VTPAFNKKMKKTSETIEQKDRYISKYISIPVSIFQFCLGISVILTQKFHLFREWTGATAILAGIFITLIGLFLMTSEIKKNASCTPCKVLFFTALLVVILFIVSAVIEVH